MSVSSHKSSQNCSVRSSSVSSVVEQISYKDKVLSSNLRPKTTFMQLNMTGCKSTVDARLWKSRVVGSAPTIQIFVLIVESEPFLIEIQKTPVRVRLRAPRLAQWLVQQAYTLQAVDYSKTPVRSWERGLSMLRWQSG